MSILDKKGNEWLIILAVGLGAYGGFPKAPKWWENLAKKDWFQFICLWLLVYIGGGKAEIVSKSIVTFIVYVIMKYSDRYIKYGNDIDYDNKKYNNRFYN